MRYMKLDPSYLNEQKENILHINSIDFFQGKELPLYKRNHPKSSSKKKLSLPHFASTNKNTETA